MNLWMTNARDWIAGGLTAFGCAGLILASFGPGVRAESSPGYAFAVSTGAALDLRQPGEASTTASTGETRAMTCERVVRAAGVAVGYRCASARTAALPTVR